MKISERCLSRRFIANTGGTRSDIFVNILAEAWPEVLPGEGLSSLSEAEVILIVVMLSQQGLTSFLARWDA